jgi:hypothetical protein
LRSLLARELGPALDGWMLYNPTGISSDGRTIVGYGLNPFNQTEAWIAVIPEPTALPLLPLLSLSLGITFFRSQRDARVRSPHRIHRR